MKEFISASQELRHKRFGKIGKQVVHVRKDPFDIYIGRAFAEFPESIWHNPFKLGPHRDGTRKEVLEKYREYVRSRPDLMARLPELRGKVLGCWCKPLLCHGDVLVELVEDYE